MCDGKKLVLKKRPTVLGTFYKAFKAKKHKVKFGEKLGNICVEWNNIKLNHNHINRFNKLCKLEKTDSINILYPFTFIYPINLWLISHPAIPVPMLKMLTTRNTITIHRNITADDILVITSTSSGQRFLKNGMEFYINSEIKSDGELLWENKSTFFIPGKEKNTDITEKSATLYDIDNAEREHQWYLPAENGFRFAGVMGDSNGIHYSKRYARLLGFKRDFAQPVLVASKVIEYLPEFSEIDPLKLDLFFKGPVYYNSTLTLKYVTKENSRRFDLYYEGNERPCICGELEKLAGTNQFINESTQNGRTSKIDSSTYQITSRA